MHSQPKKTLILGASTNPTRYANMATHRLLSHGHEVVLLGRRTGEVAGHPILKDTTEISRDIHTVTLYLSEENQKAYEDFILELKPQRVIFNPGAENPDFEEKLKAAGIEPLEACTLVMLATGLF
ncbi:MAG: CoA-binding protein [Leadbetterella sp.]|nr:CoA-binding protein [Leadbetterella sp.]